MPIVRGQRNSLSRAVAVAPLSRRTSPDGGLDASANAEAAPAKGRNE
jgi:hypothetical protein